MAARQEVMEARSRTGLWGRCPRSDSGIFCKGSEWALLTNWVQGGSKRGFEDTTLKVVAQGQGHSGISCHSASTLCTHSGPGPGEALRYGVNEAGLAPGWAWEQGGHPAGSKMGLASP